jgi:hypothetical protein
MPDPNVVLHFASMNILSMIQLLLRKWFHKATDQSSRIDRRSEPATTVISAHFLTHNTL